MLSNEYSFKILIIGFWGINDVFETKQKNSTNIAFSPIQF